MKIPNNLEEAYSAIDNILEKEKLLYLLDEDENTFTAMLHSTLGRWMRNNWGFWGQNSKLYKQLRDLGLSHADDMSGLVLTSYYRQKHSRPLNIDKEVAQYKNYWINIKKLENKPVCIDDLNLPPKEFDKKYKNILADVILAMIETKPHGEKPADLRKYLVEQGFDEGEVRSEIARLWDHGEINVTNDRKIKKVNNEN